MIITGRDLKLINDLYLVRYLNSKRIAALFGNYKSAMRRLGQLKKARYVFVSCYMPNRETIWSLDKKGYDLIDGTYYQTKKSININHTLACADFYFYLCKKEYDIKQFILEELIAFGKNKFRPDIVLYTDKWYLVEIDLTNRRFEDKVCRWERYYNSFAFTSRFELFPPILIVSSNVDKVKKIIDKCKTIDLNYGFMDYKNISWKGYRY